MQKVSALGGEAIEERQQKLVTLLRIENSSLTTEEAQQILDCVLQYENLFALNSMDRGEVRDEMLSMK